MTGNTKRILESYKAALKIINLEADMKELEKDTMYSFSRWNTVLKKGAFVLDIEKDDYGKWLYINHLIDQELYKGNITLKHLENILKTC